MNIPPLLQTLANEDKNAKRTREEGSSSAMETTDQQFEISYRNRPKLNPITKQEDTIEIVETTLINNGKNCSRCGEYIIRCGKAY